MHKMFITAILLMISLSAMAQDSLQSVQDSSFVITDNQLSDSVSYYWCSDTSRVKILSVGDRQILWEKREISVGPGPIRPLAIYIIGVYTGKKQVENHWQYTYRKIVDPEARKKVWEIFRQEFPKDFFSWY